MAKSFIASLLATIALASPLEARNNWPSTCNAVSDIINIMQMNQVATPYCSTILNIPTVTQTKTVTSSPACTTITQPVATTDTVTAVSVSVVLTVTTVYPVVAVSTISTCALGATQVPAASVSASSVPKVKRQWGWQGGFAGGMGGWFQPGQIVKPAVGVPNCINKWQTPSHTPACSCLNLPTPTVLDLVTVTLPVKTVTKVVANVASVTVTSVSTSTSFTSTYSGTQFYTSTFTVLPQPTQTMSLQDGATCGVYTGLDFAGLDIDNFFCYKNGPTPPSPYSPTCSSFTDCVAECGFYNDNKLGASKNQTCGAVVYNAPADGSSGSCYLKTGQVGCGSTNNMTNTCVWLPLIPNDVQ